MKLKNFLTSLTVIISSLFITTVKAAAPSSYDLIRDTSNIINYNEDIVKVEGPTHALYFPLKYSASGNYLVFCSGDRSANTENSRFTKTNFVRDYDGAVVAAIIKAGVGENATKNASNSSIFFTQIAIWKALAPNAGNSFPATEAALSSSQRELFNSLLAAGEAAKTSYNDIKNFSIKFDATSLSFTLNGDVYESQVIKVLGKEIKTKTLSVNKGEVVEKDGGYVVRIGKSLLAEGKNTITLKANATSNTIKVASNYTNGKSDQQTTTITVFDEYSNTAEATINGEINIESKYVSISKIDATTSKELPGATLVLKDSKGNQIDKWVSTNTPHKIKNLAPGKYTLTETIAPEGYKLSTETVEFTVESDGTVKNPVVMKNYPDTYVEISKVDATTSKELPGATLVLKDSKGKQVDKWVSTNTPHKIKNLAPGKYTLTETIAPEGYKLSTETVEFTVEKDGTVKNPVVMKNYPDKFIYISKVDATNNKELPGATLVLKDSKGKQVDKWVSTNTPHEIKNLAPGKYTLTETIAPEGYKLSTETVEFTVEKDGTVKNPVVMKNYPDTYVEISKVDATNGEELPGATLVLKDSKGKVVETWISGSTPHKIKNLDPGKYTLTETIAPDGYVLSTDTVTFNVEKDGTVKEPVVMKNYPEEPKTVYISKQDITTGEELPGAYLEIKNESGEVVEAWISSNEPHKVQGLEPGKYTLIETIAPDGYELSKEAVEFTVKEDGTVDGMVIMYNKPEEIEVPNTASFKTITASLIGLIVIGLGSMMIYKNYKKNEEY